MITGQIFVSIIVFFINTYYSGKLINYNAWQQIKDIFPILMISFVMMAGVYFIVNTVGQDYLKLIIGFVSGSFLFLGLTFIGKFDEMNELKKLLTVPKNNSTE